MEHNETRVERTENAFREVNETIARAAERYDPAEVDFVCECADPSCAHRVTAPLDEYEEVRSDATRFIVAPGHDEPSIERVVRRRRDFHVVEKFGATVAALVRRMNPRARPA